MRAATLVLLFAFSGAAQAQTNAAPTREVTIALSEGKMEYCMGAISNPTPFNLGQDPDDIALRLPLILQYENHRTDTIFLPLGYRRLTRMTVEGQKESVTLRDARTSAPDAASLMALSNAEAGPFWIVPGKNAASVANLSVLKYRDTVQTNDSVVIPVRARSSGLDLRGKTIQIVTSRDFSSIAPDVASKLNEKWKNSGTVWTGVAESNTLTLRIPQEPPTRNCMTAGQLSK